MSPVEATQQFQPAPDKCTESESNSNVGGIDAFRNALTQDDFKKIDSDGSDSLTMNELTIASADKSFPQPKLDAIDGLAKNLRDAPKLKLTFGDEDIPIEPIIPSWFGSGAVENADGGGESLDFAKDDPLVGEAEKPRLTEEQLKQKLDSLSEKITERVPENNGKNGIAAWSHMMKNYFDIQSMWGISKALPGDPMSNMENALNNSLKETGHTVKLHKTDEPNTPKHPWMKSVDGYITVDPKPANPKSPYAERMGAGIIGLTGSKTKEVETQKD